MLISSIRRGGKADEGEVRRGYILMSVDGEEIESLFDFKEKYAQYAKNSSKSYMLFLKFAKRNWFAVIKGDDQK